MRFKKSIVEHTGGYTNTTKFSKKKLLGVEWVPDRGRYSPSLTLLCICPRTIEADIPWLNLAVQAKWGDDIIPNNRLL